MGFAKAVLYSRKNTEPRVILTSCVFSRAYGMEGIHSYFTKECAAIDWSSIKRCLSILGLLIGIKWMVIFESHIILSS